MGLPRPPPSSFSSSVSLCCQMQQMWYVKVKTIGSHQVRDPCHFIDEQTEAQRGDKLVPQVDTGAGGCPSTELELALGSLWARSSPETLTSILCFSCPMQLSYTFSSVIRYIAY